MIKEEEVEQFGREKRRKRSSSREREGGRVDHIYFL